MECLVFRRAIKTTNLTQNDEFRTKTLYLSYVNTSNINVKIIMDMHLLGVPVAKYSFTYGANWVSLSQS